MSTTTPTGDPPWYDFPWYTTYTGSPFYRYYTDVVTNPNYYYVKDSINDIDVDALWEKIYTRAKSIWFACPYCNSANAIGNSTCCQCGAPLGSEHGEN